MELYLSSPICRHGVDRNKFLTSPEMLSSITWLVFTYGTTSTLFSFSSTYLSSLRLFCKSSSSLFSFVFFSVRTLLFEVRRFFFSVIPFFVVSFPSHVCDYCHHLLLSVLLRLISTFSLSSLLPVLIFPLNGFLFFFFLYVNVVITVFFHIIFFLSFFAEKCIWKTTYMSWREVESENVELIQPAQNRIQWLAVVNLIMKLP